MSDQCECLSDCGDDPKVQRRTVKPCDRYIGMLQRKRLIDAAPELLAALKHAREVIKTWHGPDAWEIYDEHSPEMQRINSAIRCAEGYWVIE